MTYEAFIDLLEDAHFSGSGVMARCPAHEDRRRSLSVNEAENKILVKCQAGCATPAVVKALGLEMRDLFTDSKPGVPRDDEAPEAVYVYTDTTGTPVLEVHRFAGKKFLQKLAGHSDWGLHGLQNKPLFHLPQLLSGITSGRRVWIVEGEKDVLALERAGAVATCSLGGAGKWHNNYAHQLRGAAHVRIVADKDEPGVAHAEAVSETLRGIPHEIVQAKEGAKDAHDHLAQGGTLEDFIKMPKSHSGVALKRGDMFILEEVKWIPGWDGFFPFGGITSLVGMPGVNKSTLTCRLAAEVSAHFGVLMVTSEDSISAVVLPRLAAAGADMRRIFFETKHLSFPRDLEGVWANVEEENIQLVVIDPVEAHLNHDVDAHKNQSIRGALAPLGLMADVTRSAVVIVGHPNKNRSTDPMMRAGGSIGIPGVSRSALIMGNHPDTPIEAGRRVLASYKGNWGTPPKARVFNVEPRPIGQGQHAIFLNSVGEEWIRPHQLFKRGVNEGGEE